MNRKEFELKLKEAGFESDSAFSNKLKIMRQSITEWHKKKKYPKYVECLLGYIIKVRKVELIKKTNDYNAFLKEEIKIYEKENLLLKDEIISYKKLLKEEDNSEIKILDENYNGVMTREEFDNLLKECNFSSYYELSDELNIHIQTVINWNKKEHYPNYIKQLLIWIKEIRQYKIENEKNKDYLENIESLEEKNKELKNTLENCKLMEKMLKEKIKAMKN